MLMSHAAGARINLAGPCCSRGHKDNTITIRINVSVKIIIISNWSSKKSQRFFHIVFSDRPSLIYVLLASWRCSIKPALMTAAIKVANCCVSLLRYSYRVYACVATVRGKNSANRLDYHLLCMIAQHWTFVSPIRQSSRHHRKSCDQLVFILVLFAIYTINRN